MAAPVQILDANGKPYRANGKPSRKDFVGRATAGYTPGIGIYAFHPGLREGYLQWTDVPAMLRDPAVQLGLTALKSPLAAAEIEVVANSKEVQGYVESAVHQFRQHDLDRIAEQYYTWGTCPAEVVWHTEEDKGLIAYRTLDEVYHLDTRVSHVGREVLRYAVTGAHYRGAWGGAWVEPPKMFWATHKPPVRSPFGRSKLVGAWAPWMEKRGAKGAVDARRLWYFKYSFQGGIIYYPAGGQVEGPNGSMIDNEDLARELVEKAEVGFTMACPYVPDENGGKKWEYQPAKINGSANDIRDYNRDLDEEIWMGMNIPPEILRAGETGGGWSGRSVPLLVFLHAADSDVSALYGAFDRGVCRPGVAVNFGHKARYQLKPVSLIPKPQQGGPAGAPGRPGAEGPPKSERARDEHGHFSHKGTGNFGPQQQQQQGGGFGGAGGGQPLAMVGGNGQNPVQMSAALDVDPAADAMAQKVGRVIAVIEHGPDDWVPAPEDLVDLILGGPVRGGDEPVGMSAAHAPAGGQDARGKHYAGGQFTPADHPAHERRLADAIAATPGYALLRGAAVADKAAHAKARAGLVEHYGRLAEGVLAEHPDLQWRPTAVRNMGRRMGARLAESARHSLRPGADPLSPEHVESAFDWTAGDALGARGERPDTPERRALERAFLGAEQDPAHRHFRGRPVGTMTPEELRAWHAGARELARPAAPAPGPVAMSAAHAPAGGIEIKGRRFKGGEFIPADVAAQATPEQKKEIGADKKPGAVGKALAGISRAEHSVKEAAGKVAAKLPVPAQKALGGAGKAVKALYVSYAAAQNAVAKVAEKRGMSREAADGLSRLIGVGDLVLGGKLLPVLVGGATLAVAGPAAAALAGAAASFTPVASLGFLGLAGAEKSYGAARDAVRRVLGKAPPPAGEQGRVRAMAARVPEQKPASERAARARAAHVLVDRSIQRYAEEHNEPRLAKALGGVSHPDNEPKDISTDRDLVELKTVVKNGNGKITMDSYAQVRKIVAEREEGKTFHTVVSDDSRVFNARGEGRHDGSKRVYYYRRGVAGSARIAGMYRCRDEAELKKLMALPENRLPPAARRTDGKLRVGRWKPFQDERGKGFRNQKTGRVVRAKPGKAPAAGSVRPQAPAAPAAPGDAQRIRGNPTEETRAAVARWLAASPGLPGAVAAEYGEHLAHALSVLPAGVGREALSSLGKGRGVRLHADLPALRAEAVALGGKAAKDVVGFAHDRGDAVDLHLDGGPDPRGTYVHELWHAADQGGFHSDDKGWQAAYKRDVLKGKTLLSRYAMTNASEGFAEFGRVLAERGEKYMEANFPSCVKHLKARGLL